MTNKAKAESQKDRHVFSKVHMKYMTLRRETRRLVFVKIHPQILSRR